MMNFFALATAFRSILGDVQSEDIWKSLELMGKGMLGIFIVTGVIIAVVSLLNKLTESK